MGAPPAARQKTPPAPPPYPRRVDARRPLLQESAGRPGLRAAVDIPPAAPRCSVSHPALTHLSEEERLFRDSVLDFARKRIAPRVAAMDEAAAMDLDLLPALHEMGLMGIDIPEAYGGSGAGFFNAILAIEALAVVDPSVSVLVDVQNTLVANALL